MTQKNKRLSGFDRAALKRFALKQIMDSEPSDELDNAYELAADFLAAVVVQRWPEKDMRVLAKYDAASPDACIYVTTGGGDFDRFTFRDDDKRIPMRPNRYCRNQPVMIEGEAAESFLAFERISKEREQAIARRRNDFYALIDGTPSFNALCETWPLAEAMREQIVGTSQAIAVLSTEVVDRLRADPAFAAAA